MPPQVPKASPSLTKTQRADKKFLRERTAEMDFYFKSIEFALGELQTQKRTASKIIKKSFTGPVNADKLVGIDYEATEERFRIVCLPCPVYALD
jgi:hypothetical protein